MNGLRALVCGAMLVGLVCHAVDAQAQSCQKDNDCAGDLVCNGGQCQTLSGATPPPAAATATPATAALGTVAASTVAGTVPVRFEGYPTTVTEQGTGQSCEVPCSMQLVPGSHLITGVGSTWKLIVGNQGTVFNVSAGDQGMMAGGLVAVIFGTLGFSAGLTFVIIDKTKEERDGDTDMGAIGWPLLLGGGALLGTAIGLAAGADKPSIAESTAPKPATGTPMVGLAPTRGGVLMGATLQF